MSVLKLLSDAGDACAKYHNEHVREVRAYRIQCDEIWSFCYEKAKNVQTAMDAGSKQIVSYLVGGRDIEYALEFMDDVRSRLANRVHLTTDDHKAYLEAVEGAFGGDIDNAQLVKLYGTSHEAFKGRYSPAQCIGSRKTAIEWNPNMKNASTSHVERQNLTMRMQMRRFTRLINAFSKKIEYHIHAISLHFMFYNFCRIHKSLRVTPAMQAGLADKVWELTDIVALIPEQAPKNGALTRNGQSKKFNFKLDHYLKPGRFPLILVNKSIQRTSLGCQGTWVTGC